MRVTCVTKKVTCVTHVNVVTKVACSTELCTIMYENSCFVYTQSVLGITDTK